MTCIVILRRFLCQGMLQMSLIFKIKILRTYSFTLTLSFHS